MVKTDRFVKTLQAEDGFALIGTLWLSMFLSVLLLGLTLTIRAPYGAATRAEIKSATAYRAEAALAVLMHQLIQQPGKEIEGDHNLTVFGEAVTITIKNEAAKINLNRAPDELLLTYFNGDENALKTLKASTRLKRSVSGQTVPRAYFRDLSSLSTEQRLDFTLSSFTTSPVGRYMSKELAEKLSIAKPLDNTEYYRTRRAEVFHVTIKFANKHHSYHYVLRGTPSDYRLVSIISAAQEL